MFEVLERRNVDVFLSYFGGVLTKISPWNSCSNAKIMFFALEQEFHVDILVRIPPQIRIINFNISSFQNWKFYWNPSTELGERWCQNPSTSGGGSPSSSPRSLGNLDSTSRDASHHITVIILSNEDELWFGSSWIYSPHTLKWSFTAWLDRRGETSLMMSLFEIDSPCPVGL